MKTLLDKFRPLYEGEGAGSAGATPPAGNGTGAADPSSQGDSAITGAASGDAPPAADGQGQPPSTEGEGEAPAPLTAADITLPEGFEANEEQMNAFLEVVNDASLDPKTRSNKLAEMYAQGLKGFQEKMAADWVARQKELAKEIETDPEIGGKNMDASNAHFAHMLSEFGDEQLVKDLIETGMGNRLSMARFLVKVGKVMSEGKPLVGEPTSETTRNPAEILYPNQGKV